MSNSLRSFFRYLFFTRPRDDNIFKSQRRPHEVSESRLRRRPSIHNGRPFMRSHTPPYSLADLMAAEDEGRHVGWDTN